VNQAFPWREAPSAQFAVMGDRVQHSMSPQMHQAAFDALGLPYRYVAILVEEGEFALAAEHLARLGYLGANVTAPLKEEAFAWAQSRDDLVVKTRAANTVRFRDRATTNTDVAGFARAFEQCLPNANPVLVLGAGGAARAAILSLVTLGYEVTIWNRTTSKAVALAAEFGVKTTQELTGLSEFRGVVNATRPPVNGEGLAFPFEALTSDCGSYDLSYGLDGTEFTRAATAAGLKSFDGKSMLAHQGAIAFDWWLGIGCDYDVMAHAIGLGGEHR
jgi:shikimate dehydrogenase